MENKTGLPGTELLCRIHDTDELKDVYEKLFGHRQLPPFLLAEEKHAVVAAGMGDFMYTGLHMVLCFMERMCLYFTPCS